MRKHSSGTFLVILGLALVLSAFGLTGYNLWDNDRATRETSLIYDAISSKIPDGASSSDAYIPDYILNPNMDMPTIEYQGYKYIGTLCIPVIDLELPVMDSWSYPQLKTAPCRYDGSIYLNNMVIAAHNYTGHFGRLKNLQLGDVVIFTDVDGNVFNYKVSKMETLVPSAVEEMKSGNYDLTVFTCTVGGQTRVTVRCMLDNNS